MKAQVSIEFLFVFSVLSLLALIFFLVLQGQKINLYQSQDSLSAMRNAYALSAAINYAHLAGEGTEYNFTLSGVGPDENITVAGFAVESFRLGVPDSSRAATCKWQQRWYESTPSGDSSRPRRASPT